MESNKNLETLEKGVSLDRQTIDTFYEDISLDHSPNFRKMDL